MARTSGGKRPVDALARAARAWPPPAAPSPCAWCQPPRRRSARPRRACEWRACRRGPAHPTRHSNAGCTRLASRRRSGRASHVARELSAAARQPAVERRLSARARRPLERAFRRALALAVDPAHGSARVLREDVRAERDRECSWCNARRREDCRCGFRGLGLRVPLYSTVTGTTRAPPRSARSASAGAQILPRAPTPRRAQPSPTRQPGSEDEDGEAALGLDRPVDAVLQENALLVRRAALYLCGRLVV